MILPCKPIAEKIKREIKAELANLKGLKQVSSPSSLLKQVSPPSNAPHLVSIQVGEDKGAAIYINAQKKVAEELGIIYFNKHFKDISQRSLLAFIQELNKDKDVNAIIVHLPLPPHIQPKEVFAALALEKDVEAMHPQSNAVPCTPLAIIEILKETREKLEGKEMVIVGSSDCVGKPLLNFLLDKMATVTVCNIATENLILHTQRADVLIVAAGKPNFIKLEMVKKGAVVVDVGINYVDNKIVGDVDREVEGKVKFLTPVPGGVGLVTTAMLMKNTLDCYKLQVVSNNRRSNA